MGSNEKPWEQVKAEFFENMARLDREEAEKAKRKALEAKQADVVPFNPWPTARRPWTAEPSAASNAMPYAPSATDRLMETQRAVAAAARQDRLRRDPWGLGLYSHESLEDVIRRQNGDE
jgi:hypothetical protein